MRRIHPLFLASLLFSATLLFGFSDDDAPSPKKQVAFVIDDFGNGMAGTKEMMELPIRLTVAVMPFLPTTKRDATWAHQKNHDVFVHIPMEPVKGKKRWLGPGAITTDLSNEEIETRMHAAIDDVPFAIGVNNHMGSKVTADRRVMNIVLKVCRERGLIYLDSRTTNKSVAKEMAQKWDVPYIANDIFLDEVYSMKHILKQMNTVCKTIAKEDSCIAIGHVGPPGKKTAEVLRRYIPIVDDTAVIVPVSKLVKSHYPISTFPLP
ncbi:divergent polysaccharide deacetylase family protein [Brevibacillus dissolubilis]|uniref:divergent polysaccharide deacetylase family protein n=1 Tax=Brevibacillus dissolubilis TaxID=1844116 RepID=UPI001115CC61|nr:divergent polysaccharide deacetylase family protein [Brevibacillus dissolubilis]